MPLRFRLTLFAVAVAIAAPLAGCGGTAPTAPPPAGSAETAPAPVRPGAPGEPSRPADAPARPLAHTEADVRFMQDMIHHHAQALEMSAMVPERSEREEVRLIALRIHTSQEDEIAMMQRWLRARGADAPEPAAHGHHEHHGHHGHHGHHATANPHEGMPGMLTPAQLAQLEAARGTAFDRLFLEFMIFHHEGAITMVEDLFAAEGAGQDAQIFEFASHVDADQRAEILRMRQLLASLSQP